MGKSVCAVGASCNCITRAHQERGELAQEGAEMGEGVIEWMSKGAKHKLEQSTLDISKSAGGTGNALQAYQMSVECHGTSSKHPDTTATFVMKSDYNVRFHAVLQRALQANSDQTDRRAYVIRASTRYTWAFCDAMSHSQSGPGACEADCTAAGYLCCSSYRFCLAPSTATCSR